jgi:small-conductance mechanosensitive channel
MNLKRKFFIGINFLTVVIAFYKLFHLLLEKGGVEFLTRNTFVFTHLAGRLLITFFIISLPFELYLIALIFYLFTAIFLLQQILRKRIIDWKIILFSFIILLGVLGSYIHTIGP